MPSGHGLLYVEPSLIILDTIRLCSKIVRYFDQQDLPSIETLMHLSILCPTTPPPPPPPIRDTGGDWWGLITTCTRELWTEGWGIWLPRNLCHEVRMAAKKVWVSWQSLGEPERNRVVTFIGGRKELNRNTFRCLQRGGNLLAGVYRTNGLLSAGYY